MEGSHGNGVVKVKAKAMAMQRSAHASFFRWFVAAGRDGWWVVSFDRFRMATLGRKDSVFPICTWTKKVEEGSPSGDLRA